MFKNLLAFAAAASAAIIVTLVPTPGPAAGSALPDIGKERALTTSAGNSSALLTNGSDARRNGDCRQTWPYYEQSCLHDARQRDGKSRSVRVIALGRTAKMPLNAVTR